MNTKNMTHPELLEVVNELRMLGKLSPEDLATANQLLQVRSLTRSQKQAITDLHHKYCHRRS